MIGGESLDEFHLEIVNSTLVDEAEYQCQVAPAAGDRELVGTAHLTVTGGFCIPWHRTINRYTNVYVKPLSEVG